MKIFVVTYRKNYETTDNYDGTLEINSESGVLGAFSTIEKAKSFMK